MKPNQTVEIRLVDSGGRSLHIPNVFLDLHFFCGGRYRYAFRVGGTNETGSLRVSYQDVELLRLEQAQMFLMDFNTKLEDCDPRVGIHLPSGADLEKAVTHAKTHYPEYAARRAGPWSTAANRLVKAADIDVALQPETTEVTFPCSLLR